MFNVYNKDTVTMSMTSSWCLLFVNFEHIPHLSLVFLLSNLNRLIFATHQNINLFKVTVETLEKGLKYFQIAIKH